ncbi:hypothetical protein D9758_010111 [Tetrapyrgos nigripes]|uniref:RING-type domain-containing protein n=1 Tax=Tetrapyrgos nigripes TaxID=182062 RepID=A0A8H5CUL6_9AGAR|nr:hypothetical protein D9758_010111 [Tetrapyrgos nigripes]
MDQNASTFAELRAEQVDQISDNVSKPSCNLASLDGSADPDSSSSSPFPQRLQRAMRKLMDLERVNQTNGFGPDLREFDELAQLLGRLVALKERENRLPVVRYLPCTSDLPPSEVNGPASPEWLAMFVHSDVPSICIGDHNACCNICLEHFEEPALASEFQVDGGDDVDPMADGGDQASPKPLRKLICGHVLHEECLPMFQSDDYNKRFECPACRTKVWTRLPEKFSLLLAEIYRDAARNSVSSDQQQIYDDYYNSLNMAEDTREPVELGYPVAYQRP